MLELLSFHVMRPRQAIAVGKVVEAFPEGGVLLVKARGLWCSGSVVGARRLHRMAGARVGYTKPSLSN